MKLSTSRLIASLLCFSLGCFAQGAEKTRTIDLKPYGFEPVTNREYKARIFTSSLEYLKDGTLIVAFPSPYSSLDPMHELVFNQQRATILHFDPSSGKLLHRFEGLVSNELRFLAATPDGGFLLLQRRELVFYSKDCVAVGSIKLPLDIESMEVSPSRRLITLAAVTDYVLHLTIMDTTTHASLRQYDVGLGPIVMLSEGYATLKQYTVQGVSIGGVRRIATLSHGHDIHFVVARPRTFDLGMSFDCPVTFESAAEDSAVFATCGNIQVMDQNGRRLFQEKLRNATVIRVSPAMESPRLGYSVIRGPYAKTTEQLRAFGKDFRVRVADLVNHRVIADVPVTPFPRIGGVFGLSADGRGLAVMTDGTLEIYRLP